MKLSINTARAVLAQIDVAAVMGVGMCQDDKAHLELVVGYIDTFVRRRILIERAIIRCVVRDALAKGYACSVHDGEEWAIRGSTSLNTIMREIGATDEDRLVIETRNKTIGAIHLVYGNDGFDVIADHTAQPELIGILANAETLAGHIGELLSQETQ